MTEKDQYLYNCEILVETSSGFLYVDFWNSFWTSCLCGISPHKFQLPLSLQILITVPSTQCDCVTVGPT